MNWDRVEGKWKQLRGEIMERWGEFTDDDLDEINGRREQFLGKLQERYGLAREKAEEELAEFFDALEEPVRAATKRR